jgi:prephenate dehydrogenase
LERLGTVAIVGVGLIGGSLGMTLRDRRLATRVIGVGRHRAGLALAQDVGAIDAGTTDPTAAFAEAEVAVICTPVTRIAADAIVAARHGPDHLLITDAGSTKEQIVRAVEADPRARAAFVGAHPIAGSEKRGPTHARPDLFEGRVCLLTPTPRTAADRLERARDFWTAIGCRVSELSPSDHDKALALTSHLPHVIAAALAGVVPPELHPMAAGAYRDVTRVAGSDAELWTGIFLENRSNLLSSLDTLQRRIDEFQAALIAQDQESIRTWWNIAKNRRAQFTFYE